jgi:hypothetical protein
MPAMSILLSWSHTIRSQLLYIPYSGEQDGVLVTLIGSVLYGYT